MSTEPTEPTASEEQPAAGIPAPEPEAAPAPEPAAPAPHAAAAAPEPRPELLIGGAFLGGMILAKLLGRRHGR